MNSELFNFDRETWIYFILIALFLIFFIWNSRRAKKINRERKSKNFRRRYLERKKENLPD
ncbi:hypothetical protein DHD80_19005 [Gramella sp. AN32]|nr:hypothetical protein [Gramella sp. AN32]